MTSSVVRVGAGAAVVLPASALVGWGGGDVDEPVPTTATAATEVRTDARLTSSEAAEAQLVDEVAQICSGLAEADAATSAAAEVAGGDAVAVAVAVEDARDQVRDLAAQARPGYPRLQEASDDDADVLVDAGPDGVGPARSAVDAACLREAPVPVPVPPDDPGAGAC